MQATAQLDPRWQRPISVAEYHHMIDAGVFGPEDRLELLEGVLAAMTPQEPPHARAVRVLTRMLDRGLEDRYWLLVQLPLTLARSEPEPDLAVVEDAEVQAAPRHPRSAVLVVEVADSSLGKDRLVKTAVYADAGVEEYWIIDVDADAVEVHRSPEQERGVYRSIERVSSGVLRPRALPCIEVDLARLFA